MTQQSDKPVFFYGWYIVMIGALSLFFSGAGQTYSNAIFIDYYIQDFNWGRSLVSGIYSAATFLAGMLLFKVGSSIDKFGTRKVSLTVSVLLAFAAIWNSFVIAPWMLFIGFFLIRLLGQGSMTLVANTLVPQWFIVKRGRALSLMMIGGFISSTAFPPMVAWLIEGFGWQTTWRVLGIMILVIFVPIVYFFMKDKPEDIGLLPDNKSSKDELETSTGKKKNVSDISWTLKEAKKTRQFWLLLVCVSIPSMLNTGLTFHLISMMGGSGLSPTQGAFILSLMAAVGFPVTMAAGFVLEKVRANYIFALVFVGQFVFLIILLLTDSFVMAIVFGVVWGLVGGIERIVISYIFPDYFGRQHIGSIKGIAQTMTVIGSAFGPLPFGFAYDYFGGYTEILLLMFIFPAFGIVASLLASKPKKNT
ncbi:MFS transporter [Salisediminibacterium beveridgei]|uniref:Major facilitator superfamily MFS_1 n=1 Tax=Salisediminibacterium beveridgei TaxID=632773 RepID=A0A1D7QXK0_9BACI|nr:MFS transporter [Salisediminibacterium beveridgei]AOM83734.1 Major facilitator superfamily MFS_1 [Salisediminibacterium beveridgei]